MSGGSIGRTARSFVWSLHLIYLPHDISDILEDLSHLFPILIDVNTKTSKIFKMTSKIF